MTEKDDILSIDILSIDEKIRKNFDDEFSRLPIHQKKLDELKDAIKNDSLKLHVKTNITKVIVELEKYILELNTKEKFLFYVLESVNYIEEYKNILKIPVKISFMGKAKKDDNVKKNIIIKYLEIASKYIDIDFQLDVKQQIKCNNCANKKDFEILEDFTYICTKCYARQNIIKYSSSYTDIDRVNISSKYMYDPKIHFRDCIKQYQGKQNCTISQKIYDDLEEQFKLHHLLLETNSDGNPITDKQVKFSEITKNHVMIFLKELGYSKHYENVHLIHYTFTGIKPDDISYLEDKLLNDFDDLIDLYHKRYKTIKRKNFINTQYVLYQLLRRHHHTCKKEEFIILKTIDRKFFHDEICKALFEELGWNHSPYY